MKTVYSILTLFFVSNTLAQNNIPIQWGNLEKFSGSTEKIVNLNGQSFTAVINRIGAFAIFLPNQRKLILREVTSLNSSSEKKIQLKGNNRNLSASEIIGLNNEIITLSYRKAGFATKNEVFAHKFNLNNIDKSVQGEQIISYFSIDIPSNLKQIGMTNSEDLTKAAAFYTIPLRPNEFQGFGYVLYDNAQGKYAQHTTQLPYQLFQLDFSDAFLSNNGDFYVIANEFYPFNGSMPISPNNRSFAKVRAFKAIDGQFSEFDINRDGIIIQNLKMTTDSQDNFVASGFYADDMFSGVRGVFFMTLDRNTNEIIKIKKQPFTAQFISTGQAAWEQSWRDRFRQNTSKQQALSDFRLLDFRQTQDGGYIAITENQSVVSVPKISGTPENPRVTYTDNFFFDDLIVYKLDELGNLVWVKRIPKNQRSTNGGGKYLSVAHGVTSDKVYLLFNDVQRNYDSGGQFIEGQFPFPIQYASANNAIAYLEINLADGSFPRQARPGLKQNKVIFVPSLSEYNYNTNEMILYGKRNRSHRFGYMKMR